MFSPSFVFVRRLRAPGGQGGRGERREQRRQEGDGTKMVHFRCRRVYEATFDLQAASSSGGLSIASECAYIQSKLIGSARGKISCETRRYAGEGNISFEQKQGAPVSSLLIVKHVGGGGCCGCPTILANLIYVCLVIVYNTYTYIYFSAIITVFLVPFNYSL